MAIFNNFPWTNMHGMNLDYFLAKLGELKKAVLDAQKAQELAELAEDGAQAAEQGAKDYADAAAQSADAAADSAEAAQTAADSIDPDAIQQAIDTGVQDAKDHAEDYTDNAVSGILTSAKDYTDTEVGAIQTELNNISDFKQNIELIKIATLRPTNSTDLGPFVQGACKVGRFIFACDTGENRIIRYDTTTEQTTVVASFNADEYGHMNDACYDGSYIYVAPCPDNDQLGKIYRFAVNEVNGSLGSATALTVPGNLEIWNIAYDADAEMFYTVTYSQDHADIVKFTVTGSTVNIEDVVTGTHIYDHWPDSPRQGIETANGFIYCLSGGGTLPLDASVTVFDLNGVYVSKMMLPTILGEPECLLYDRPNKIMLCGANLWGYTHGEPREAVFFVMDYKSKYSLGEVKGLDIYDPVPYDPADPYAVTMINDSRYPGYAAPDTIVRAARAWWNNTLKVKLKPIGQFAVLINHTGLYQGWFAGSPVTVNFERVAGSGVTATATLVDDELTITTSENCAITVLYFNGYRM